MRKSGNRCWPRVGEFFGGMVVLLLLLPSHPFAIAAEGEEFRDYQFPLSAVPAADPGEQVWKNRFYLGLGGFYGLPADINDITVIAQDFWETIPYRCPVGPDTSGGAGFSLKGGYFFAENFALEALFQYHPRYKLKGDYGREIEYPIERDRVHARLDGELRGWDFSLNPKYFFLDGNIRPYGVGGLGYMGFRRKGSAEGTVHTEVIGGETFERTIGDQDISKSKSSFYVRIGGGCDLMLSDNLGVELEAAYNLGLDSVDEIKIFTVGLHALIFF